MRNYISVLALMALPACFGVGNGVDLTPSSPDAAVTSQAQSSLDGTRIANAQDTLTYNATVGRVAQSHANDMFDRNYLSILELGSDLGGGVMRDLGDDLNDSRLFWDEIIQMVEQGDMTVDDVLTQFATSGSADTGVGSDQNDFGNAMNNADYELFGIGKAGSGDDTRWALLLVDPT